MFSRFFIERPIFASVIALFTVLAGAAALLSLPVALYPDITPPTVRVNAVYPGADPQSIAEAVAEPIEAQVNGVEGMLYMSSTCAADGSYSLTITFETGTDIDQAAVLVQNRVSVAVPKLPPEAARLGVTTRKQSTDVVMLLALLSDDEAKDDLFLANYAALRVRDELARVPGVGDVALLGAGDYSMRIWLDPDAMEAHRVTTSDVRRALLEQNVQVAAGKVGAPPSPPGTAFEYTVRVEGHLADAEQFRRIIIRQGEGGSALRLGDVARIEVGSRDYSVVSRYDGRPAAVLLVYQLPGANALDVAAAVRQRMDELAEGFPEGVRYEVGLDTTEFISASIHEVVITLLVAIVLVVLTIWLFLQDWRATVIPAVAIPVSLVGTFVIMAALGFTVNMITLFGLVLAIGIVVDDAIVVVENTDRNIQEKGLAPREAAIAAMEEVAGAVVATTLVLLAVFVPTAFMGGITGGIFRQFALTISGATVISSVNALTLSPALSGVLLRRRSGRPWAPFRAFNRAFDAASSGYLAVVRGILRRTVLSLAVAAGLAVLAVWGLGRLPSGFLPEDDSGYLFATAQLPDAATVDRTYEVTQDLAKEIRAIPGVRACVGVTGYSLLDGAKQPNAATFWISLESFDDRGGAEGQDLDSILARMQAVLAGENRASGAAFVPPSIPGLGASGGFEMRVLAKGGQPPGMLEEITRALVEEASGQSNLAGVYTTFRANSPQVLVDVDRDAAKGLGVPLDEIFGTLGAYLGGAYVNDFTRFGRSYQVKIQAEGDARAFADQVPRIRVRNIHGKMVPLGSVATVRRTFGPQVLGRFNMYPAALVSGSAAPGVSSGQALDVMEETAAQVLPPGFGFAWSGLSFQERAAGGVGGIFLIAIVFVYLFLAAQYESWTVPLAVILVVPVSLLGTVAFVAARRMDLNVYTQIGIVLLVALAAKNAILIVEFAMEEHRAGKSPRDAAFSAARLRFRPILMTSLSFVLGTFPLVIATGAGAAGRQALGTAVFGGMIAATVMSTLLVPLFYAVIENLTGGGRRSGGESPRSA